MAKVKFKVEQTEYEKKQHQENVKLKEYRKTIYDRKAALQGKKKAEITMELIYEQNQLIIDLLTGRTLA